MDTYKTKTVIKRNHKIEIDNLPFEEGLEVEILVSKKIFNENIEDLKKKLKGSVLKYEEPFESAINSVDWELLK